MVNRFLFTLLLICLPAHLLASSGTSPKFIQQAENLNLAQTEAWLNLLHFKKGRSELDDPKFFLAKNGKKNPAAELNASLEALLTDISDTDESIYCKFYGRANWLMRQLPELKNHIQIPSCPKLTEELENLKVKRVVLVFAASHINSPASAFGHTFLRLDDADDRPLSAYAVNYAAETAETNGLIYAYKGIFGGYQGRYSVLPYAKKVEEYNDLEKRDLWEYPLNLTQEEIQRLLEHLLEIRHYYADYFFLDENCSYNLLWLLQIARPGTELVKQFNFSAMPVDTLRAIEEAGFIEEEIYRPSQHKRQLAIAEALTTEKAWEFVKNYKYDLSLLEGVEATEKAAALEIAAQNLRHERSQNKISHEEYTKTLLDLLRERSKLPAAQDLEIYPPTSPKKSHYSARLSLGASYRKPEDSSSTTGALIGFKPAFHSIEDNDFGNLPGAFINFFDLKLHATSSKLELESLYLLDLRSYAAKDKLSTPISWQVKLGADKFAFDKHHSFLQAGAGLTLGNERAYFYGMLSPGIYYRKELDASFKAEVGALTEANDLKLGLNLAHEWFNKAQDIQSIEAFATYRINQAFALNINYQNREFKQFYREQKLSSNIYYYF